MKKKESQDKEKDILGLLRSEAEKILSLKTLKKQDLLGKSGLNRTVHELQVYQVELEMQNDELKRSQEALEKEKERFSGLFNLAPIGYFILKKSAVIED